MIFFLLKRLDLLGRRITRTHKQKIDYLTAFFETQEHIYPFHNEADIKYT